MELVAEDGGCCVAAQTLIKLFGRRLDHYSNQFATQVCPKRSRSAVSGELCFSDR